MRGGGNGQNGLTAALRTVSVTWNFLWIVNGSIKITDTCTPLKHSTLLKKLSAN